MMALSNIPQDGVVLRNLKRPSYKLSVQTLEGRVISSVSYEDNLFISVAGKGILIFKIKDGKCEFMHQIHPRQGSPKQLKDCMDSNTSCCQLSVSSKYLVYIKDRQGRLTVCIHECSAAMEWHNSVVREIEISRQAPLVVDHQLDILCIGCSAWAVSWTTQEQHQDSKETNESHIRTIDMKSLKTLREWKVVENSISLLRHQITAEHHMVGIADTRTGLSVYDLRQPEKQQYVCLYQVPVEEIRNFHLVGNFVAVFHKFEPNVTFWNMKEQKTILCINIQDQMRELAEEFLEDDEEDCGLYGDDDDHVTMVTSVRSDDDFVLMYGTKSGCIFGMSVNNRLKLFNIPCPHDTQDASAPTRQGIQGLQFIHTGQLAVVYEKHGLTVMDFSMVDPPDRPPTRSQKRQ